MAGQKQQALHQLLHTGGFLGDGGDAFVQHLRVSLAPALQHAYIALNDGDGRAQLVRSVADKLLLAVVAQLDPVQHAVDDQRQILQFILGALHADAVAQVVGAQRGGGLGHVGDGLEHLLVQPLPVADEIPHPQKVDRQQRPQKRRQNAQRLAQFPNEHGSAQDGVFIQKHPGPLTNLRKEQADPLGPSPQIVLQRLFQHIHCRKRLIRQLPSVIGVGLGRLLRQNSVDGAIQRRGLRGKKSHAYSQQHGQGRPQQLAAGVQRHPQHQRKAQIAQKAHHRAVYPAGHAVQHRHQPFGGLFLPPLLLLFLTRLLFRLLLGFQLFDSGVKTPQQGIFGLHGLAVQRDGGLLLTPAHSGTYTPRHGWYGWS